MLYRVFTTESEAIAAEAVISAAMGYPKPGINAATGEVEPDCITERWAVPQQIADGRWVFPSPDDEGVEADEDWFPTPEDDL
jgi:hypothetical protein